MLQAFPRHACANSPRHKTFSTVYDPALQILKVRPDIGAIVVKGAVPGKAGNVLEITPAKIVGKNIGPQVAKKAAA